MSKNVKTQTPQSGIGPRRGNMFAETEYAKDIGWTLKRIGLYFVKEKKLIFGMLAAVLGGTLAGIYAPCCKATPWISSPGNAAATCKQPLPLCSPLI